MLGSCTNYQIISASRWSIPTSGYTIWFIHRICTLQTTQVIANHSTLSKIKESTCQWSFGTCCFLPKFRPVPQIRYNLTWFKVYSSDYYFFTLFNDLDFFRFELDFRGIDSLLIVLKSLLRYAPDLERLVLFDDLSESKQHLGKKPSEMADFLLHFALKMKRLVAMCIVSPLLDEIMMQDIRFRIAKNVVPEVRKSLWFNIGGECPTRSDPDVLYLVFIIMNWLNPHVLLSLHISSVFFLSIVNHYIMVTRPTSHVWLLF